MAAGEFMLRQRRLEAAIDHWERAVRLQADLLGAHQRLAMVFQRQGDTRRAVREYLAIARILQARGDQRQALRVCEAALRLDPGNEDVLTAMELVRYGAEAFEEEDEVGAEELPREGDDAAIAAAIRQMAAIFESERVPEAPEAASVGPVEAARRRAQEQLAEEIFRDEEDEELMYGMAGGRMSKLERDALLGQGIDFESRGQRRQAIQCYQQAVDGGLDLPAIYFTLGMLYLDEGNKNEARHHMARAARDPVYEQAAVLALGKAE
jgi:tetratricopeptide (TPR) repeat protein